MAEATLPEEMIVLILSWLPVKSLVRFSCVSKRFHSIIISDQKFAKSQFQAARDCNTLTHRLLYSTTAPKLESLDLESPSFGDRSSVRKLKFPFQPTAGIVSLLGSCNGIVFLAFSGKVFYTWNPSTGYFNKLPDPRFSENEYNLVVYGVGYLPATDDYRVFVVSTDFTADNIDMAIFSSRAHAWKIQQSRHDVFCFLYNQGILLKEALHWLNDGNKIEAFDLGQEEKHKVRKMLLPRDFSDDEGANYENHLGVSVGGCLSLARKLRVCGDCIDVWVMGEYGVHESWTKLFNLKYSDPPKERWNYISVLVLETCMVAYIFVHKRQENGRGLVKIGQKEEDTCSIYKAEGGWFNMIQYQESLLRIED